jgi:hypothetical protein
MSRYKTEASRQKQLGYQRESYRRRMLNKKVEPKQIITEPQKPKVKPSLSEILNVLRKDNRHYLWRVKSIIQWTEKDWFEFNKLKSS